MKKLRGEAKRKAWKEGRCLPECGECEETHSQLAPGTLCAQAKSIFSDHFSIIPFSWLTKACLSTHKHDVITTTKLIFTLLSWISLF